MSRRFLQSSFCFAAPIVGENLLRDERHTSTKKLPRRSVARKKFRARALSNRDFILLSSIEKLTAAQRVQTY
jgi:hypothetical protein